MSPSILNPPSFASQSPEDGSVGTPAFERLLDSEQAAALLGNIHLKTLQKYARLGEVPSYRIGGHWYFRISELDEWVRSRLNSSCRPSR